jgi:hypothetical protein
MAGEEKSLAQIKAAILNFVEERGEALSLEDVLKALKADSVRDDQIKAAIWALISESAIELTPAYMIQAGPALHAQAG